MKAYYNEIEPYAAAWLRNLITAGLIANGDVDERDIREVKADDVRGYTQCHFFAGIGGWSYALRQAGWGDDRSAWTGSCPCQPFSVAGRGKAQTDERHLWPAWFSLIKEVSPTVIFGEQVSGAIAHGWLDDAFDDLERQGYETAAVVLPACSVGAPHKRDRLWFVADSAQQSERESADKTNAKSIGGKAWDEFKHSGYAFSNPDDARLQGRRQEKLSECASEQFAGKSDSSVANPTSTGPFPAAQSGIHSGEEGAGTRHEQSERHGGWEFEPAVGRVANGISARAHKLRAYGNAIVPQVAAEFIKAYRECVE